MTAPPRLTDGAGSTSMRGVRAGLRRIRRVARSILISRGLLVTVGVVVGLLLCLVLSDYVLRFPRLMRGALLAVSIAVVVRVIWKELVPAFSFKPALTEIALRLEQRSDRGSAVRGLLASGLELERGSDGAASVRGYVTRRAADVFGGYSPRGMFRLRPLAEAAGTAVLALVIAGVLAGTSPDLASTGLTRALAPWTDARWPSRTEVADATVPSVHPTDEALELRAVLEKWPGEATSERVEAVFRVVDADGRSTDERRVLMTPQGSVGLIDAAGAAGGEGFVFERVLEPASLAAGRRAGSGGSGDRTLVYRFESRDDRTPDARVTLTPPPRLVSATAVITPPAYAASIESGREIVRGDRDLLVEPDGRVRLGPLLGGSTVRATFVFSKPVEPRGRAAAGNDTPADAGQVDDAARAAVEAAFAGAAPRTTVTVDIAADAPLRVAMDVADEYGFPPRADTELLIDVLRDRLPSAAVLDPMRDEDVLPTAMVGVEAEGRDDLGVASLRLERTVQREAGDEPAEVAAASDGSAAPERAVRTELDLGTFDLTPGDAVELVAVASDFFRDESGPREPSRSPPRTLRVISEDRLVEQIRSRLTGVERAARELDRRQGTLEGSLRGGAPADQLRPDQADVAAQVGRQREEIERLADRVSRNGLDDAQLASLLSDTAGLAAAAERAAGEAAERLADASVEASPSGEQEAEGDENAANQEQRREAAEQQSRARDALGRLLDRLDRGEDSYLARRGLERLLEDQRELAEQTQAAGSRTIGQRPEDLGEADRAELSRLAERQEEVAKQAQEAIDRLAERGDPEASRENGKPPADPVEADAMRRAAQAGRRAAVPEELQQAAGEIEQNRASDAQQRQEAAIDALEEMLEQLEDAEKNRDAALRRELASVMDSIRTLIARQSREIGRLLVVQAGEALPLGDPPLDRGMIALFTATLETLDRLAVGFDELVVVATFVQDAADEQESAIEALREEPAALAAALAEEREALALLEQALEEAESLDEEAAQREQDRVRQQLRADYGAALEEQRALRDETGAIAGDDLTRRERGDARRLGRRQETLRGTVADVFAQTEGLAESTMVGLVHSELEMAMGDAGAGLRRGTANAVVLAMQDRAVALLETLVDAFTPFTPERDDDFGEDGGGGGGGGGSQQGGEEELVEALTELRIMRAMQAQLLALTRALGEAQPGASSPFDTSRLAAMQTALAERGAAVIEKIEDQSGGPDLEQIGGGGGGDGNDGDVDVEGDG
ncbi:MAG: hypothetical protein AAF235_03345 [Planctomycetota bacterium]